MQNKEELKFFYGGEFVRGKTSKTPAARSVCFYIVDQNETNDDRVKTPQQHQREEEEEEEL